MGLGAPTQVGANGGKVGVKLLTLHPLISSYPFLSFYFLLDFFSRCCTDTPRGTGKRKHTQNVLKSDWGGLWGPARAPCVVHCRLLGTEHKGDLGAEHANISNSSDDEVKEFSCIHFLSLCP